jgi:hypothetical protein
MRATSPIDLSFLDGDRPAKPWDAAEAIEAIRLEVAADDLIAQLGVDGRHPEIAAAAERAVAAHHRHDLGGVRAGVAEVERLARELAAGKGSGR